MISKRQILAYVETLTNLYGFCLTQASQNPAIVEHNAVLDAAEFVFQQALTSAESLKPLELGFCQAPGGRTTIYLDGDSDPPWYTWDGEQRQNIISPAICGYVAGIEITQDEYKGKLSDKLFLLLQCGDHLYRIKSGIETVFTRSLCLGLEAIVANLKHSPVTIVPQRGEEKTVFCRLYLEGQYVKTSWLTNTSDADWKATVLAVSTAVNSVVGTQRRASVRQPHLT